MNFCAKEMKMQTIEVGMLSVNNKDFSDILFMAFRYALKEEGSGELPMVNFILKYWDVMDCYIQECIVEEIKREHTSGVLAKDWNRVLTK